MLMQISLGIDCTKNGDLILGTKSCGKGKVGALNRSDLKRYCMKSKAICIK